MNKAISREVALRLGLARRALPDGNLQELLRVLDDAVGLPPTREKLEKLTLEAFSRASGGAYAGVPLPLREAALAALRGESLPVGAAAPPLESYLDGDMPGSLRVACASNGGEQLDGHFGACENFLIYQVSAQTSRLIDLRRSPDAPTREEKNTARAALLQDCQLLFAMSIGGPAAAKLVRAGVHPVKVPAGGAAQTQIDALRERLATTTAPWLLKAMGAVAAPPPEPTAQPTVEA